MVVCPEVFCSRFGTLAGYVPKSLRHMIRFVEAFPEFRIVTALLRQLLWTHFVSPIYLDAPLKRDFYRVRHRAPASYRSGLLRD